MQKYTLLNKVFKSNLMSEKILCSKLTTQNTLNRLDENL